MQCQDDLQHVVLNATQKIKHRLNDIEGAVNACNGSSIAKVIQHATTDDKIKYLAGIVGVDPKWALAIAEVESAMGKFQLSRTGAKGVFQMTTIAMKDLLQEMQRKDDDMIDILCGLLFLRLLLRRHKTIEKATSKYCDPNDRDFYVPKVLGLMADD